MSVQSTSVSVSYVADGIKSAWAVPFYFMSYSDLIVTVITGGVPANSAMNVGWLGDNTVQDSYGAYPSGGTITFQPGQIPAAGATITIVRQTSRVQPDKYLDGAPLPSSTIEHDLDRLTLIAQENTLFLGVTDGQPASAGAQDGQWYLQSPQVAGGFVGWVWVAASAAWKPFGIVSQ